MEVIAPYENAVVELPGQPLGPARCFARNLAVVIGIDGYGDGIADLRSAAADARLVGEALARDHGFEVWLLTDEHAGRDQLLALLRDTLPATLGTEDRLLFYFAGHGIAIDGNAGPEGYLVPAGATRADKSGFLPMQVVHDELAWLPVRHALIMLDCCFSGAFRWSSLRDAEPDVVPVFRERYERYVASPAWQTLTSASHDQLALDGLANDRGDQGDTHSPFARALIAGLSGAADYSGDGIVTADELLIYVRKHAAPPAEAAGHRQVPQLFPLERHAGGQFVFQVPGRALALMSAPALDKHSNPYRGLASFGERDRALFFGRAAVASDLVTAIQKHRLTVVVGPSGSGKSSLVHAGAMPGLRSRGWQVLPTQRPATGPLAALGALARALDAPAADSASDPCAAWRAAVARRAADQLPWLVVIDQLEELSTHRVSEAERTAMLAALAEAIEVSRSLRVVITVRSDAETAFHDTALASWWMAGRFAMPAVTRDDLREVIEKPAAAAVLCFEPARLVEQLLADVALVPAPLPLLSFGLSELYRRCWQRWQAGERDRALRMTDFLAMGSVARALMHTASAVHDALVRDDAAFATTIRNVFIRMVAVTGGERARRRVPLDELVYDDPDEVRRIRDVLERFHEARLIALDMGPGDDGTMRPYAEPMHDELVRGWGHIGRWLDEIDAVAGTRALLGAVTDGARAWQVGKRARALLWSNSSAELADALGRSRPFVFNACEARFVRDSVALRRAQRGRLIGGLLAVIAVLAVLGGVALRQTTIANDNAAQAKRSENEATRQSRLKDHEAARANASADEARRNADSAIASEQQARHQEDLAKQAAASERRARTLAEVRQLAAQSEVIAIDNPMQGLRMAVAAAAGQWNDLIVQQALYDGFARMPGRELYHHAAEITALAVRDDGELVASGASDGSLAVVRSADSTIIAARALAPGASIERLWFLPDDRIAARTEHKLIGKTEHKLIVEPIRVTRTLRDSDRWVIDTDAADAVGGRVAVARSSGTVEIWEFAGGRARAATSFDAGSGPLIGVSFDGRGTTLLTSARVGSFGVELRLWETDPTHPARMLMRTQVDDLGRPFTLSRDGSFATGAETSRPVRIDRERGTMAAVPHGEGDRVVEVSEQRIVVGRLDNTIGIFDRDRSLQETPRVTLHSHQSGTVASGIEQLVISPGGGWLASIGQDAGVFLWRFAEIRPDRPAHPIVVAEHDRGGRPGSSVATVAFSRDEQFLVTGGHDGDVRMITLDGSNVAAPAPRRLRSSADRKPRDPEQPRPGSMRNLAMADDGSWLAGRRADGEVCVWMMPSGDERGCFSPPSSPSQPRADLRRSPGILLSTPGSPRFLDVFPGNTATLWTIDKQTVHGEELAGWSGAISHVAASADRQWLAGVTADTMVVWDITGRDRKPEPRVCRPDAQPARWASAEVAIAIADHGRLLYVLEAESSRQLTVRRTDDACTQIAELSLALPPSPPEKPYDPKWSISVTASGRWLAALAGSHIFVVPLHDNLPAGRPVLLRTADGDRPYLQENAPDNVIHVAFSPDGTWLAAGHERGGGCLWDLTRPSFAACARELTGVTDSITALVFSPDGTRLALGSYAPNILVWDLRDRAAPLGPLRLPRGAGWNLALAFGRDVIVASTPAGLETWPLSWSGAFDVAERILGRSGAMTAPAGRWSADSTTLR